MDRDFRQGYLALDFPTESFTAPAGLLLRAARLFLQNIGFLAMITLAVYAPVKFPAQLICNLLGFPPEGLAAYLVVDITDLILGALVAPAVVYGLVSRLRTGALPPLGECLRWGRRLWGKSLWNRFKVEITIALWGALLIVPGLIAMVKLIFVDPVVAIEADREPDPIRRSRQISQGRGWKIFAVVFPVMVLEFVGSYLVLSAVRKAEISWALVAAVDCLLSVGGQFTIVTMLLMYLGLEAPAGNRMHNPPAPGC